MRFGCALLLVAISVLTACRKEAAAPRAGAVPLVPPADAREVWPNTFVRHLWSRPSPGRAVEEMREIFFIETIYDQAGREAGAGVPSAPWSHLSAEQRATIAGMRAGDRRRIWRCPRGRASACRVEDVQVFDAQDVR